MDKKILVALEEEKDWSIMPIEVDIAGGRMLLKALDKAAPDIRAALWLYLSDSGRWRLILGSPLVDQEGPRSVYAKIESELVKLKPHIRLSLMDISVVGLNDEPIHALLAGDYQILTEHWLRQLVIGSVFVEAAYIYDLKKL